MNRNSWRTPKYIFEEANKHFNFGLDVAASNINHLCDQFFTKENSALDKNWASFSKSVWCNPPYGRGLKEPFFKKALKETSKGVTTVFFVPSLPSEKWFPWDDAKAVVFVEGRVNFLHPITGLKQSGVPAGSCFIIISPKKEKPLTSVRTIDRVVIERQQGDLARLFKEIMN